MVGVPSPALSEPPARTSQPPVAGGFSEGDKAKEALCRRLAVELQREDELPRASGAGKPPLAHILRLEHVSDVSETKRLRSLEDPCIATVPIGSVPIEEKRGTLAVAVAPHVELNVLRPASLFASERSKEASPASVRAPPAASLWPGRVSVEPSGHSDCSERHHRHSKSRLFSLSSP